LLDLAADAFHLGAHRYERGVEALDLELRGLECRGGFTDLDIERVGLRFEVGAAGLDLDDLLDGGLLRGRCFADRVAQCRLVAWVGLFLRRNRCGQCQATGDGERDKEDSALPGEQKGVSVTSGRARAWSSGGDPA
jgi:hypothetical protein